MFQLTSEEVTFLRSQTATSNRGRGGRRCAPYAFTEQGVAMLSSVLNSKRAIQVNIEIMPIFVRLRQMVASNERLARKMNALEKRYDAQFKVVFDAIPQLMTAPEPKKRKIGFWSKKKPPPTDGDSRCSFRLFGNSRNVQVPAHITHSPPITPRPHAALTVQISSAFVGSAKKRAQIGWHRLT